MKKKDIAQKMINGKVKPSQKGRASLEIPKGSYNENGKMFEGKNETNRP